MRSASIDANAQVDTAVLSIPTILPPECLEHTLSHTCSSECLHISRYLHGVGPLRMLRPVRHIAQTQVVSIDFLFAHLQYIVCWLLAVLMGIDILNGEKGIKYIYMLFYV